MFIKVGENETPGSSDGFELNCAMKGILFTLLCVMQLFAVYLTFESNRCCHMDKFIQ